MAADQASAELSTATRDTEVCVGTYIALVGPVRAPQGARTRRGGRGSPGLGSVSPGPGRVSRGRGASVRVEERQYAAGREGAGALLSPAASGALLRGRRSGDDIPTRQAAALSPRHTPGQRTPTALSLLYFIYLAYNHVTRISSLVAWYKRT